MNTKSQIVIFKNSEGQTEIKVKLESETIWLSQKQMSELFDKDSDTIGLHLKNIYKSGELELVSTTEKYSVVQQEGKRKVNRNIQFYNLDAIISVGYRVNSKKGTEFRIWATKILKQHIEEGYTKNKTRLSELRQTIELIQTATSSEGIEEDESKGIIR